MADEGFPKSRSIQRIRGFPLPNTEWFTSKTVEEAMDYMPQNGAIIVASYPKTGSTWMQYIVMQILSRGEKYPTIDNVVNKEMPILEMTGTEAFNSVELKFYKCHLPYNLVQKNDKAKHVYIYRNPADVVVSYYHFLKELYPGLDIDFEKTFDDFLSGELEFGSYFEHILSYYKGKDNLLMVSYEKLLTNQKEEILKIAKFLGEDYYQDLVNDETLLNTIIERTSFDYMKKNLSFTHPSKFGEKDTEKYAMNFFRKGKGGDGKKTLTNIQQQLLKDTAKRIMKGTEILYEWMTQ